MTDTISSIQTPGIDIPPEEDFRPDYNQPQRERKMTDNDAWVLQVSLKSPRGALINIRGANSFDLAANLEAIRGLASAITEVEDAFMPAIPPALSQVGATQVGQYQQPAQQYPQQAAPPSFVPQQPQAPANAPLCQHNIPAKYVPGGMSKTGRPYRAFWACSLPREQQCQFRGDA